MANLADTGKNCTFAVVVRLGKGSVAQWGAHAEDQRPRMPYRRLPNTDAARLRAMKQAYELGRTLPPHELAFSQNAYTRVGLFINKFEDAVTLYRQACHRQAKHSRPYQQVSRKAKLYVSHFIQVMNMEILRGELKPEVRAFYGLDPNDTRVPKLNSDQDVVDWGQRVIDGEQQRISEGHAPILNPTAALVKVQYEQFLESFRSQRTLQNTTARTLKELDELRQTADQIILDIWNEVEATYADRPDVEKRAAAEKYGVVYVYRKNEPRYDYDSNTLLSTEDEQLFKSFAESEFAKQEEDGKERGA